MASEMEAVLFGWCELSLSWLAAADLLENLERSRARK